MKILGNNYPQSHISDHLSSQISPNLLTDGARTCKANKPPNLQLYLNNRLHLPNFGKHQRSKAPTNF